MTFAHKVEIGKRPVAGATASDVSPAISPDILAHPVWRTPLGRRIAAQVDIAAALEGLRDAGYGRMISGLLDEMAQAADTEEANGASSDLGAAVIADTQRQIAQLTRLVIQTQFLAAALRD